MTTCSFQVFKLNLGSQPSLLLCSYLRSGLSEILWLYRNPLHCITSTSTPDLSHHNIAPWIVAILFLTPLLASTLAHLMVLSQHSSQHDPFKSCIRLLFCSKPLSSSLSCSEETLSVLQKACVILSFSLLHQPSSLIPSSLLCRPPSAMNTLPPFPFSLNCHLSEAYPILFKRAQAHTHPSISYPILRFSPEHLSLSNTEVPEVWFPSHVTLMLGVRAHFRRIFLPDSQSFRRE